MSGTGRTTNRTGLLDGAIARGFPLRGGEKTGTRGGNGHQGGSE